jgi:MFS family permease
MLLSVMGGCVAFAMTLITPGSDSAPTLFTFLLVVNNFCVACCDVLADAMVAEFAKLERGRGAGNLQVCVFGSQNLGQIVLNIFAGDVLAWCGPWPMFAGFGIMQAGIAGVAMTLHETPDEEPVTVAKVKRQLVLLKKTLQYPPIYMPAIFFFLINGGRPDITNGALQLITDQDNGYGINVSPVGPFCCVQFPVLSDGVCAVCCRSTHITI